MNEKIYNKEGMELITLAEAEKLGYALADTLKMRIHNKNLKGIKKGKNFGMVYTPDGITYGSGHNTILQPAPYLKKGRAFGEGSIITPAATAYQTNSPAAPRNYTNTLYQTPDSISWTKTLLDSIQIGARVTTAKANTANISTLWALVEFVSSGSPSASLSPSLSPSRSPSLSPSVSPSISPSVSPSFSPSISPSLSPSISPSISPSASPAATTGFKYITRRAFRFMR